MAAEDFTVGREIFLRLLAVIYFLGFTSLAFQVKGLYGRKGVQPIHETLRLYKEGLGSSCYWKLPTIFWLGSSDSWIFYGTLAGAALSFAACITIHPLLLALLWALYLSYMSVGREFLSYQWDVLLLETGFIAIFFACGTQPALFILVGVWLLLFRLMFSSGLVKLMSGDAAWRDLTAMHFHFESQPLPTRAAWWAHQLPDPVKKSLTASTLFVELVVPFGIFGPPEVRMWCVILLIALQLAIFATGNYCFFNLLTIALCLTALDNGTFGYEASPPEGQRFILELVGLAFIVLNTLQLIRFFYRPLWLHKIMVWTSNYHISGGYGLFAVMTTKRREIIVEGSSDGIEWKAYELRWKPHKLNTPPKQAAPHQPRLDWQFWFASLSNYSQQKWLHCYLERLLEGSSDVHSLIANNPFPDHPPKWVRAQIYDYHFTTIAERKTTGNWWKRQYLGSYSPPLRLK